jgi:hypothetical protein
MRTTTTALLFLIAAAPLSAANTTTGRFERGTLYEAPRLETPAETSRMSARAIRVSAGRTSLDLPVTGEGGVIIWTMPATGASVTAAVTTPGGQSLAAASKQASDLRHFEFDASELDLGFVGGRHEVVHAARTEPGSLHVELQSDRETMVTVAVAEPDSSLKLMTWASPMSRRAGTPVALFARVEDGDASLNGVSIRARLASPSGIAGEPIELFDDGRHGDAAAGDGLYAASVNALPREEPGFWQIRFDAEGSNARGVSFARSGGSSFMNERLDARLIERGVRATVVNDGSARVLRIVAPATAQHGGNYRLDVIVAGPRNDRGVREQLLWSETSTALDRGRNVITVDLPLDDVSGELLLDVRLLGLDSIEVAGHTTLIVPN